MERNYAETVVVGSERMESSQRLRTVTFLRFFKVNKWESMLTTTVGIDLHIETGKEIDRFFLNGKEFTLTPTPITNEDNLK